MEDTFTAEEEIIGRYPNGSCFVFAPAGALVHTKDVREMQAQGIELGVAEGSTIRPQRASVVPEAEEPTPEPPVAEDAPQAPEIENQEPEAPPAAEPEPAPAPKPRTKRGPKPTEE